MFSTAVRGEKAFAAEQKLKELKKKKKNRFKAVKKRLSKKPNPYEIMKKSVDNMNSLPSAKCKQTPNKIEKIHLTLNQARKNLIF